MSYIIDILSSTSLPIIAQHTFPARSAVLSAIPANLHDRLRQYLTEHEYYRNGLYSHQSAAIQEALAGYDICLATSTASGKSLVFQTVACHMALIDPGSLAIAIYPARALVQDQLQKWKEITQSLGVSVGQIDGSVKVKDRQAILDRSSVVVMTPDVLHGWLLRTAADNKSNFQRLRLLILDEAHVYSGAFGTNTAYLLRRLAVLSGQHQVIASTATIGDPLTFLQQLTGRSFRMFFKQDEGSPSPEKRVVLSEVSGRQSFATIADLMHRLVTEYDGRFLVFADSRKMVEELTRATLRLSASAKQPEADQPDAVDESEPIAEIPGALMPYRSGYETVDRYEIQKALLDGHLRGVISTSALELGLDIGDIDLVVMVDTPPSIQAFWQRFGRAGRRGRVGECLLIDSTGTISAQSGGLSGYLTLPPEPNYLYLGNEVVQYTNALAAARELQATGGELSRWDIFGELPPSFREMVSNEINPTHIIPDSLFNLKQRAGNGPHHEFPLRAGGELNFRVKNMVGDLPLGELTFAQMVREAYPGAIYLYQARPYRVRQINYKDREIGCRIEFGRSTQPTPQVMVFPNLATARHRRTSEHGFLIECDVQVSEQVTGFTEKKGNTTINHVYGPGSEWSQDPVRRFLRTSGVLWHFDGINRLSDESLNYLIEAFTRLHGVHRRDLGAGVFQSNDASLGANPCKGICIYDDVVGGLRLTERLASDIERVIDDAIEAASRDEVALVKSELERELIEIKKLPQAAEGSVVLTAESGDSESWIELIGPNQPAMLTQDGVTKEIEVLRYFVSPKGEIQYVLRHANPNLIWKVPTPLVSPIFGSTKKVLYNRETGEEKPC